MKKYLFGLSAIVLAIAFSAFTTKPFKSNSATLYLFEFVGNSATDGQVDNEANWRFIGTTDDSDPQTTCADQEEDACVVGLYESSLDIEELDDSEDVRLSTAKKSAVTVDIIEDVDGGSGSNHLSIVDKTASASFNVPFSVNTTEP